LTVTRNNASSTNGVFCCTGTHTISNSLFSNNYAAQYGVIYTIGRGNIYNSTFLYNTVGMKGGAISSGTGSLSIALDSCYFEGNSASLGGAIYSNVPTNISNSIIDYNNAHSGGALYMDYNSKLFVNSTTIINNTASGCFEDIYCSGGALTIYPFICPTQAIDCMNTLVNCTNGCTGAICNCSAINSTIKTCVNASMCPSPPVPSSSIIVHSSIHTSSSVKHTSSSVKHTSSKAHSSVYRSSKANNSTTDNSSHHSSAKKISVTSVILFSFLIIILL